MNTTALIPTQTNHPQPIIEVETLSVTKLNPMKKIAAVIAESGQVLDLEIRPGTSVTDILSQLGRSGPHIVTLGKGNAPLSASDNVYQAVPDGAKIFISTPVEVGG